MDLPTAEQRERPTVLLIAYHFPPYGLSSGLQRTLKYVQYLPEFGWTPIVLSTHPRVYPAVRYEQMSEIPAGVVVKRAFCLDAARDLAIGTRYFQLLAIPDRWVTWWPTGVYWGLRLIRRYRPAVIWSTFPIATAHLIAHTLHRITKVPWVADIRDSMTEEDYPKNPFHRRVVRKLEGRVVRNSDVTVFTTHGAATLMSERYPSIPHNRLRVIENGYDEQSFERVEAQRESESEPRREAKLTLLHSGTLYPGERDTRPFLGALRDLRVQGHIGKDTLQVVFRASGYDDLQKRRIDELEVGDLVRLEPGISYEAALREMQSVDGLLIFQDANSNHLVPAKLYEYLRARRPIFALADRAGDTAKLLLKAGMDTITPLDDRAAIGRDLLVFIRALREGRAPVASDEEIRRHSRRERTRELAQLFDEIAARGSR